jgi:hypothetical protein
VPAAVTVSLPPFSLLLHRTFPSLFQPFNFRGPGATSSAAQVLVTTAERIDRQSANPDGESVSLDDVFIAN